MKALDQAIEDVAKAISARVKSPAAPAAFAAEDLHKLAQALSWMKFGQQGITDYRYTGSYEQTYRSDQHETHHEGEKKRHGTAGFSRVADG